MFMYVFKTVLAIKLIVIKIIVLLFLLVINETSDLKVQTLTGVWTDNTGRKEWVAISVTGTTTV